ncbi:hypothetical protein M408DRAFT_272909 [Serendipita vermifera MAFF 305830]|uniref:Uncharacterized protein n=1 Tax=Serendipita vermifera MAFF 305830 TaxID=933852 RepID=A0A0C3B276_SERVB|nr:hypothetical protein M408DRAFT_272909 [Serendipita vermifera MAFF 305830]
MDTLDRGHRDTLTYNGMPEGYGRHTEVLVICDDEIFSPVGILADIPGGLRDLLQRMPILRIALIGSDIDVRVINDALQRKGIPTLPTLKIYGIIGTSQSAPGFPLLQALWCLRRLEIQFYHHEVDEYDPLQASVVVLPQLQEISLSQCTLSGLAVLLGTFSTWKIPSLGSFQLTSLPSLVSNPPQSRKLAGMTETSFLTLFLQKHGSNLQYFHLDTGLTFPDRIRDIFSLCANVRSINLGGALVLDFWPPLINLEIIIMSWPTRSTRSPIRWLYNFKHGSPARFPKLVYVELKREASFRTHDDFITVYDGDMTYRDYYKWDTR